MGALPGSFWELLGVPGELFRASGSTKEGLQIRLRILLGLVCSLLAAEDGLGSADVVFYLLSEPLVVGFELDKQKALQQSEIKKHRHSRKLPNKKHHSRAK